MLDNRVWNINKLAFATSDESCKFESCAYCPRKLILKGSGFVFFGRIIYFLSLKNFLYNHVYTYVETSSTFCVIFHFIIQQIVTMPIYGKEALNICHPYMTDILRYT